MNNIIGKAVLRFEEIINHFFEHEDENWHKNSELRYNSRIIYLNA